MGVPRSHRVYPVFCVPLWRLGRQTGPFRSSRRDPGTRQLARRRGNPDRCWASQDEDEPPSRQDPPLHDNLLRARGPNAGRPGQGPRGRLTRVTHRPEGTRATRPSPASGPPAESNPCQPSDVRLPIRGSGRRPSPQCGGVCPFGRCPPGPRAGRCDRLRDLSARSSRSQSLPSRRRGQLERSRHERRHLDCTALHRRGRRTCRRSPAGPSPSPGLRRGVRWTMPSPPSAHRTPASPRSVLGCANRRRTSRRARSARSRRLEPRCDRRG